jgi:hypothetical protein
MNAPEKSQQDGQSTKMSSPRLARTASSEPTTEQIAGRAYELFLARGAEHGHDVDDWTQAERELRSGRN